MATNQKKVKAEKEIPQFVTKEEFNQVTEVLGGMAEILKDLQTKANTPPSAAVVKTPEEAKLEKEADAAKPDQDTVNPHWEEKAKEILGNVLERCEVRYPKKGGTIFTVVIKKEFSNADKSYLDRYHEDKRSREIGNEGVEGVEQWCKLVKINLRRPRN